MLAAVTEVANPILLIVPGHTTKSGLSAAIVRWRRDRLDIWNQNMRTCTRVSYVAIHTHCKPYRRGCSDSKVDKWWLAESTSLTDTAVFVTIIATLVDAIAAPLEEDAAIIATLILVVRAAVRPLQCYQTKKLWYKKPDLPLDKTGRKTPMYNSTTAKPDCVPEI